MLKNSEYLRKLSSEPPAGPGWGAAVKALKSNFNKVKQCLDDAKKLSKPASTVMQQYSKLTSDQYKELQRRYSGFGLANVNYPDFIAITKAYNDPNARGTFFPKVTGDPTMGEVLKAMGRDRSKYIPGQAHWAYNNINTINNLKSYSNNPISSTLFGNYDNMRNTMTMLDRYGMQGSNENRFLKGRITPEQYKSYQRWRPLMAIWMNIRGWLRSLFGGHNFNALSISHPAQRKTSNSSTSAAAMANGA